MQRTREESSSQKVIRSVSSLAVIGLLQKIIVVLWWPLNADTIIFGCIFSYLTFSDQPLWYVVGLGSVVWRWVMVVRDCLTWLPDKPSCCASQARLTHSSSLQRLPPRLLHYLEGLRYLGNVNVARGIFMFVRRIWATAMHLDSRKSRLCTILARLAGCAINICIFLMLLSDFRVRGLRSIPIPPRPALTDFFQTNSKIKVYTLPVLWYFISSSQW